MKRTSMRHYVAHLNTGEPACGIFSGDNVPILPGFHNCNLEGIGEQICVMMDVARCTDEQLAKLAYLAVDMYQKRVPDDPKSRDELIQEAIACMRDVARGFPWRTRHFDVITLDPSVPQGEAHA